MECMKFLFNHNTNRTKKLLQVLEIDGHHSGMDTPYLVLICIFALFVASTNLLLVIGLRKTNKKVTMSQKLYIYLSLTDTMVGIVCLPYALVIDSVQNLHNCNTRSASLAFGAYVSSIGMGTFLLISIVRYLAIRKPFV